MSFDDLCYHMLNELCQSDAATIPAKHIAGTSLLRQVFRSGKLGDSTLSESVKYRLEGCFH
jgi:hypothetical protein